MRSFIRIPALVGIAIWFLGELSTGHRHVFAAPPRAIAAAFVGEFCLDCHTGADSESDFDLAAMLPRLSDPESVADWQKAFDRIADGEMPPEDSEQPSAESRDELVASLGDHLRELSDSARRAHGANRTRRLNRMEYESTLRDLLDLPNLDVAERLPPDATAHGFDKVGSALELSYVQIARYLDAANHAIETAMCVTAKPESVHYRVQANSNGRFGQVVNKEKEAVAVGDAVALLRQPNTAQAPFWFSKIDVPADGTYRIRSKMFGLIWDQGKAVPADRTHVVTYEAMQGTTKRSIGTFDIGRSAEQSSVHEFDAYLYRGDQIQTWFETLDDRNIKRVPMDQYIAPGVAVDWLELSGPLVEAWPPVSHRRLFGDLPLEPWTPATGLKPPPMPMTVQGVGKRAKRVPSKPGTVTLMHVVSKDPEKDAERLLLDFATRAFRRSVQGSEIEGYLQLVNLRLREKNCFQEAMRIGFQAVLCSPDFIFISDQADDVTLASQLSYFLWNSMPDAKLMQLADQGKLNRPDVLKAQVERMLDDPKSQRFVESFTGQWLDLRRITVTEPDEVLYPEYDRFLLSSMVEETHAYFAEMITNDRGVAYLVDSDFAIVNQRMAEQYEIKGVEGAAFRAVSLPPDSVRGGLLTQSSVMKVTANGTTTSPVIRGVWIADRLLGKPVPPPPPNIPAVEPDLRGTTTIREQLSAHRDVPGCASCHKRIDPYGFALECFDVIGGYQTHYRSLENGKPVKKTFKDNRPVRYRSGPSIDCSGITPEGNAFNDVEEFRAILLQDKEQLARNLVQRLLIYATGSAIDFADRPVVETILDETRASGFGIRSLIHAVAQRL